MGTVLAATSNADGATLTTAAYAYNGQAVVKAKCLNSATAPPNQACRVWLELSPDGINWQTVDIKLFGYNAGETYICAFKLGDYEEKAMQYGYTSWTQYRFVFVGNTGAAVTVSASDTQTVIRATVPLVATTATTGGAIAAWESPENLPILVTKVQIVLTTNSTGAANVNAGIAANATTTNSGLIAATAVGSGAPKVIDSFSTATISQYMATGKFITFTGSADTTGMVATAYIDYMIP